MQISFSSWVGDGRLMQSAVVFAVIAILVLVALLIWRSIARRGVRVPGAARTRAQRLGVVDAFELDRDRQLILVRRDNVEHLVLIGGPNDVLIESQILRTEPRQRNDKDAGIQAPASAFSEIKAPMAPLPIPPNQPIAAQPVAVQPVTPMEPSYVRPIFSRLPTFQALRDVFSAVPPLNQRIAVEPDAMAQSAPVAPPPITKPNAIVTDTSPQIELKPPILANKTALNVPASNTAALKMPALKLETEAASRPDGLSNALMEALGGLVPVAVPSGLKPEGGADAMRRPILTNPPVIEPAKPSGLRFQPLARPNLRPLPPISASAPAVNLAQPSAPPPAAPRAPELALITPAPEPRFAISAPVAPSEDMDSLEAEMARLLGRPIGEK